MVKKGDLLFQIDPRSYEAALAQAQADLAKKQATLDRARADVARLKPLAREKAISQQNLDDAEAAVKVAEGDVLGSKAAVTTAELNLGYTKMVAPFDGMIGARQVDVGNFVGSSADTTLLATISTTDPMRVGFNVSETNYLRFQRRFMGRDEEHSAQAEFDLILSDGAVYPHKGRSSTPTAPSILALAPYAWWSRFRILKGCCDRGSLRGYARSQKSARTQSWCRNGR